MAEVADLQAEFEVRNTRHGVVTALGYDYYVGGTCCRWVYTAETIRDHLSGNLCRCTGYQAIIDAVEETMNKRAETLTPPDGNGREGLVGKRVTRPNVRELIHGRGRYTDDIFCASDAIAFVRSTYGHAKVKSIGNICGQKQRVGPRDRAGCRSANLCSVAQAQAGHKSALQYALAVDHVCYQGEPVVAVVASSRAEAEDAADLVTPITVTWCVVIMEALGPSHRYPRTR